MGRLEGISVMAAEIAKEIQCNPDGLRKAMKRNIKLFLENIPPEEILEIFLEDGGG